MTAAVAPHSPPSPASAVCRRIESASVAVTFVQLCSDVAPAEVVALPYAPADPDDPAPLPDDVRRATLAFARAIVEGLSGRRAPAQFGDLVSQRVLTVIASRALADRLLPPLAPASIRVQLVHPDAAEVTVRLLRRDRSIASAFRLDRRRGRWRCTALVVGP